MKERRYRKRIQNAGSYLDDDGFGFDESVHPKGNQQGGKAATIAKILIVLVVILASIAFWSCKTPQKTTNKTHRTENKNIANDITSFDSTQLYEAMSRAITTAISEKLGLSINQKIYDTDKPIDPGTGRPPLKEENNIGLTKQTDTQIKDSIKEQKKSSNSSLLSDKTKDKTQTEIKEQTQTERQLSGKQIIIIAVISLLALYLLVCLVSKFKK